MRPFKSQDNGSCHRPGSLGPARRRGLGTTGSRGSLGDRACVAFVAANVFLARTQDQRLISFGPHRGPPQGASALCPEQRARGSGWTSARGWPGRRRAQATAGQGLQAVLLQIRLGHGTKALEPTGACAAAERAAWGPSPKWEGFAPRRGGQGPHERRGAEPRRAAEQGSPRRCLGRQEQRTWGGCPRGQRGPGGGRLKIVDREGAAP